MMEQKHVNMQIQEGKNFFSDEMSITFGPLLFVLDFKSTTPRIDQRAQDGAIYLCVEHNVITIDTYHAKLIHNLLGDVITNYEKQFGSIKEPEALKIHKKNVDKMPKGKSQSPTYFG